MIRVAAVGDVHYDRGWRDRLRTHFLTLGDRADILMIAGDLTQSGAYEEAQALADDLTELPVPVVAVLGNHDYHQGQEHKIIELLRSRDVQVLEGESVRFRLGAGTVGIAGLKGFGGGFFGACVTEFGEPEMKAFAHHSKHQADVLRRELNSLDTDFRFALLHYSPVEGTLIGERKEIYPFLGSYLLAEAIDDAGADGAFHGHAHLGTEKGVTPGGIPVRNVAQTVIRHSFNIYTFEHHAAVAATPSPMI
ncbi:MAG TPA: metallophosphoesterase [Bdellovibrionota bacterium]|nr:metallophosphoesterase [Bdellovibrionota bacterium]